MVMVQREEHDLSKERKREIFEPSRRKNERENNKHFLESKQEQRKVYRKRERRTWFPH